MDLRWRLSKLLVNSDEYDKARTIYELIRGKVVRDNDLKFAQARLDTSESTSKTGVVYEHTRWW